LLSRIALSQMLLKIVHARTVDDMNLPRLNVTARGCPSGLLKQRADQIVVHRRVQKSSDGPSSGYGIAYIHI
jgi:hypothetical protein